MHKAQKKLNKAHLNRVKKKTCNASMTVFYSDILYNLDRIADNCISIADEARENVTFVNLESVEKDGIPGGVQCLPV